MCASFKTRLKTNQEQPWPATTRGVDGAIMWWKKHIDSSLRVTTVVSSSEGSGEKDTRPQITESDM